MKQLLNETPLSAKYILTHGFEQSSKPLPSRRAQESVSFMITIGSALIIFILLASMISGESASASNAQTLLKLRSAGENIASAVYDAFMSGPGYEETVTLEELGEDYNVIVRPGNVIITMGIGSITTPTNANRVIERNVTQGRILIKNEGGIINVSQV